jgi:hypothetical protein
MSDKARTRRSRSTAKKTIPVKMRDRKTRKSMKSRKIRIVGGGKPPVAVYKLYTELYDEKKKGKSPVYRYKFGKAANWNFIRMTPSVNEPNKSSFKEIKLPTTIKNGDLVEWVQEAGERLDGVYQINLSKTGELILDHLDYGHHAGELGTIGRHVNAADYSRHWYRLDRELTETDDTYDWAVGVHVSSLDLDNMKTTSREHVSVPIISPNFGDDDRMKFLLIGPDQRFKTATMIKEELQRLKDDLEHRWCIYGETKSNSKNIYAEEGFKGMDIDLQPITKLYWQMQDNRLVLKGLDSE